MNCIWEFFTAMYHSWDSWTSVYKWCLSRICHWNRRSQWDLTSHMAVGPTGKYQITQNSQFACLCAVCTCGINTSCSLMQAFPKPPRTVSVFCTLRVTGGLFNLSQHVGYRSSVHFKVHCLRPYGLVSLPDSVGVNWSKTYFRSAHRWEGVFLVHVLHYALYTELFIFNFVI